MQAHKTIAAISLSQDTVPLVHSGSLKAIVTSVGIAAAVEFGILYHKHSFASMMFVDNVIDCRMPVNTALDNTRFEDRTPVGMMFVDNKSVDIDCTDLFAPRRFDSGEGVSTMPVSVPQLLHWTVVQLPLTLRWPSVGAGLVVCCEVFPMPL